MAYKYPKDYQENLLYRNEIIEKMQIDSDFASMIKAYCRHDILYWINLFCFLNEPRKDTYIPNRGNIPFITFRFQDDIIKTIVNQIEHGKDLVISKSRDMGMTYTILYIFLWYFLFHGTGNDFLVGSINSAKTDTLGVLDSLFPKLRFNLYKQPESFLPIGFDKRIHDGYMKLINPETNSFIRGDSNNYFGTSGRYKAIMCDEFSKWPEKLDRLAWQSTSDCSNCRIAVSSANGRNNVFYKLVAGQYGEIKHKRIHWGLHPNKNYRWSQREKKRRMPADYAAEIEISFLESIECRAAENFDYNIHVRDVRPNYDLPIELNFDFNINPLCASVSQTIKGIRSTFKEYTEHSTRTEIVIQKIIRDFKIHRNKVCYLYGDASGRYGHTSSRLTDWQIIKKLLEQARWEVHDRVPIHNPSHIDRINIVNKRLKDFSNNDKSWEIIDKNCKEIINSLEITERKDNKILKNGVEHHFDEWSYGLCKNYPMFEKKIFQIKRT